MSTDINLPQITLPFSFELHVERAIYISILRVATYLNLALDRG